MEFSRVLFRSCAVRGAVPVPLVPAADQCLDAAAHGSVSGRIEALVGGGYVRNWYGAPYSASDQGLTMLLGVRYHVRDQLWLRLGADLDVMLHTADNTLFTFYNGNWGIHFGPSVRLNR